MTHLNTWIENNPVKDEMRWKAGAQHQSEKFAQLADELDSEPTVVSTHTSKSIELPVVSIEGKHGRFLLRDNFHDVNLCVQWEFPPDLALSDLYAELSWDWYLEQIERCEGYSWKGWTQEELDDPRITRVQVTHPNGNTYWSDRKPEEKERWLKRMEDPEWYYRDWSRGKLIVEGGLSNMRSGCKMYMAHHPFLQGMTGHMRIEAGDHKPFEPGRSSFTLVTGTLDDALGLMLLINQAMPFHG